MSDEKQHARLGASSCDRWWNCPGSVRLSKSQPRVSSEYAKQGTAAHTVGEICLREGRDPIELLDRVITVEGSQFTVDEEMAEAVRVYVDACRQYMLPEPNGWWIEERISLEALDPPEPMFGTSDFTAHVVEPAELVVIDYKHGAGYAVDAIGNPQLRYYGLGAALKHRDRKFDRVRMRIVQPRAPHRDGPVREDVIDVVDLLEWAIQLMERARATQGHNAPLVTGPHCKFCPAAGVCPKVKEEALAAARVDFQPISGEIILPDSPQGLSLEQVAAILDKADLIQDWLNAVRAYAQQTAERGIPVPGYKLVEKHGRRAWKDADGAAFDLQMLGLPKDGLFAEPKLKSPAQVEKLLPAKQRKEIADLYHTPVTGVSLVREESARPALPHSAARDFQPIEGET